MKFAVGDKCEMICASRPENVGSIVVIVQQHPWLPGDKEATYIVSGPGPGTVAWESWLRKLPGDSIPASTLAIFAKKQPNPDKVKETQNAN